MVPEGPRPKNMTYWQAEEAKEWERRLCRPSSAQGKGGSGAGSGGKCGDTANPNGVGVQAHEGGTWELESEQDEVSGYIAHVLMRLGFCVCAFFFV